MLESNKVLACLWQDRKPLHVVQVPEPLMHLILSKNRVTRSKSSSFLEVWPLRRRSRWALQAMRLLLLVSSSLCSPSLRSGVQSFPGLTGFRSLSHSRLAMKVAPALSGTASTFHYLIFLVRGQAQAVCSDRVDSRDYGLIALISLLDWVALGSFLHS